MDIIGSSSPDDSALVMLFRKTGIDPVFIFKAACDYYEIRLTVERIRHYFAECFRMEMVPVIVEKFCREVMINRTRLKPPGKEFYEHHA